MGAVICPPMPAFYTRPKTIEEIVDWTAARLLDQVASILRSPIGGMARWKPASNHRGYFSGRI